MTDEAASALIGRLAALPLCAGWPDHAVAALVRLGQMMRFEGQARLIRQGEPAGGAFVLLSGALDVYRSLPGGGELDLAHLAPPAIVGDIGLVAEVRRTANVRACGDVEAFCIERRLFRAACELGDPSAPRLAGETVARIGALNAQLMTQLAAALPGAPAADAVPTAAVRVDEEPDFDHRPFLPLLKPFQAMPPALCDAVNAWLTPRRLARGAALYRGGDAASGLAIVVRGALELRPADGRPQALLMLGPGAIAGLPAALAGAPHTVCCYAREHSLVLELSQAACAELETNDAPPALALRAAIAQSVADSALALGNRLAQQVGLQRAQSLLAQQP